MPSWVPASCTLAANAAGTAKKLRKCISGVQLCSQTERKPAVAARSCPRGDESQSACQAPASARPSAFAGWVCVRHRQQWLSTCWIAGRSQRVLMLTLPQQQLP